MPLASRKVPSWSSSSPVGSARSLLRAVRWCLRAACRCLREVVACRCCEFALAVVEFARRFSRAAAGASPAGCRCTSASVRRPVPTAFAVPGSVAAWALQFAVRACFARFSACVADRLASVALWCCCRVLRRRSSLLPGLRRFRPSPSSSLAGAVVELRRSRFTASRAAFDRLAEAVGDLQGPFFGVARAFGQQAGAVGGAGEAAADLRDAVRRPVQARAEAVQFVEVAALFVAGPQFVAGVLQRLGPLRDLLGPDHGLHGRVLGDLALPPGQLVEPRRVRSSSRLRSPATTTKGAS